MGLPHLLSSLFQNVRAGYSHLSLIALIILSIHPCCLFGQNQDCPEKDILDLIKGKKGQDVKPPKVVINKPSIILFPVLGSSPATGFQFGAVGQGAWFMGTPETTRISQASANITYTTKNQFLITMKSNVMTRNDRWILTGDWRYYLYSQSTYGLGTNSPQLPPGSSEGTGFSVNGYDINSLPGEDPMEFTWIRIHETALRQVSNNLFVGAGYHLDVYANIVDKNLDVANGQFTNHYKYSIANGFNPSKYSLSGLSANVVYDSRDNQINPFKGWYAKAQFRYSTDFLGSSSNGSLTWIEWRGYKSLSVKSPRHVLAGWVYANWLNGGKIPYLGLPASSYDMRNTSGRGYVQGRYRGEDIVYAETEYRFPISKCTNVLGGVAFINATTVSNRVDNVHVFDYVKAGYGVGLRIMADKSSRTNISIDVGVGDHSRTLYFGATEVF